MTQTLQDNGLLIDDAWAAFLAENDILVGLSVDGPKDIQDTHRKDRRGQGTFDHVMRGRGVYRFFRDALGATWMRFIPIIERAKAKTLPIANRGWSEVPGAARLLHIHTGNLVTERSVSPRGHGEFLIDIHKDWLRRDMGRVFVQMFDVSLEACFNRHLLCIHGPTCGHGPAPEHNRDVWTCDHFVEPAHQPCDLHDTPVACLVASPQMRRFGLNKPDRPAGQCRTCPVRQLCNGGRPKDRFMSPKTGEAGRDYLCEGLEHFCTHTRPSMMAMAHLIRNGRSPTEMIALVRAKDVRRGKDARCICGSGRKLVTCHGPT